MRGKALKERRKRLADLAAQDRANRCAWCKVALGKSRIHDEPTGLMFCDFDCRGAWGYDAMRKAGLVGR